MPPQLLKFIAHPCAEKALKRGVHQASVSALAAGGGAGLGARARSEGWPRDCARPRPLPPHVVSGHHVQD